MTIPANNPNLTSWIQVAPSSDFPIQNIPFGVFLTKENVITIGTRIGDYAIDLSALQQLGYFKGIDIAEDVFLQDSLNEFITLGKKKWREVRNRISEIFSADNPELKDKADHQSMVLFPIDEVEMQLPVFIGDYTDFYSSKEHATNVGMLFRDPENALFPNWLHVPVGYHGRSSTIVPSGVAVHRPQGQTLPKGEKQPIFGPSKRVDFELETAFITSDANKMGERIAVEHAEDHIFGMVLLNDWSARDIQAWEYVPLGPFLAKNFASSISCWVVTMDALEPYRCESPKQENPRPLPYLQQEGHHAFDVHLQVAIATEQGDEKVVSNSNLKYMYWTMSQQLAHHSVNGCQINAGDLMGSGTISGPTKDSYGSMLEITWGGQNPFEIAEGISRTFIEDHDTVIMRGYCKNDNIRIGFGEVRTKLLPAIEFKK